MDFASLAVRVLADHVPCPTEAAYLFGQTVDNQQAVFDAASRSVNRQQTGFLLIPESPARCGYPGTGPWLAALIESGVPPDKINTVPTAAFSTLNTLTEAQALAEYASAAGLRCISIIAPAFHLLRAFITAVSAASAKGMDIAFYAAAGDSLDWSEEVFHSQGVLRCTRAQMIAEELDRIRRYHAKGDLLGAPEIAAYLQQRDVRMAGGKPAGATPLRQRSVCCAGLLAEPS